MVNNTFAIVAFMFATIDLKDSLLRLFFGVEFVCAKTCVSVSTAGRDAPYNDMHPNMVAPPRPLFGGRGEIHYMLALLYG